VVSLEAEDSRHPQDAGQVQPLVDIAYAEGALPEEGKRDPPLPPPLEGVGRSHRYRHQVAQHGDEGKDAPAGRSEVHVPVPAPGRFSRSAQVVTEDVDQGHPSREVAGELAVERADDVVGPEREANPCRHCLLAAAGVDGAGDPARPIEGHDSLLGQPLQEAEPVELQASLARDARQVRGGEGGHRRHCTRPCALGSDEERLRRPPPRGAGGGRGATGRQPGGGRPEGRSLRAGTGRRRS